MYQVFDTVLGFIVMGQIAATGTARQPLLPVVHRASTTALSLLLPHHQCPLLSVPSCAHGVVKAAAPQILLPAEELPFIPRGCQRPLQLASCWAMQRMAAGIQASYLELQDEAHKEGCPREGL